MNLPDNIEPTDVERLNKVIDEDVERNISLSLDQTFGKLEKQIEDVLAEEPEWTLDIIKEEMESNNYSAELLLRELMKIAEVQAIQLMAHKDAAVRTPLWWKTSAYNTRVAYVETKSAYRVAVDGLMEIHDTAHCIAKAGPLSTKPDEVWNKFLQLSVMATEAISDAQTQIQTKELR